LKKGKGNDKRPLLISVCIGVGTSIIISLLIISLVSLCISNEYVEFNTGGFVLIIGQFLCGFLGTIIAGSIESDNKMRACLATGGAYYLLMLGAGMLLFDGIGLTALWGLLVCFLGCTSGIGVCFRVKKQIGNKKNRKRSR